MKAVPTLASIAAVLLLPIGPTHADMITIDGDNTDWVAPDYITNDPDEASITLQGYDIDYNYFEWDYDNDHVCFMFQTYAVMAGGDSSDYAEILINADKDTGTGQSRHGCVGAEYYMSWELGTGTPATLLFYKDVAGSWVAQTPIYGAVAKGDIDDPPGGGDDYTIVEWALDADDIGRPAYFWWGAYLDNGQESADDNCPDNMKDNGKTPEPTTLVLVPMGLAALAAWRRRTAA
jgi:hypothetical protein